MLLSWFDMLNLFACWPCKQIENYIKAQKCVYIQSSKMYFNNKQLILFSVMYLPEGDLLSITKRFCLTALSEVRGCENLLLQKFR